MTVAFIVKKGDTQPWDIELSDLDGGVISLSIASDHRVQFRLRTDEWATDNLFGRDTKGTGSDYISILTPASDGKVRIIPTASDWTSISDFGVYVGEFRVSDSSDYQLTQDVEIKVEEAMY